MSAVIRRLNEADAAVFQALRLAALLDSPASFASSHDDEKDMPPSAVARRLAPAPGHAVLGAFDGDALVGIAGLRRDPRPRFAHKVEIWGMYVIPAARGHGLARQLVAEAIALARHASGVARVLLMVDSANVAAIGLYESLGFAVFGREADAMRLDGQSRDDLHMSLRLESLP